MVCGQRLFGLAVCGVRGAGETATFEQAKSLPAKKRRREEVPRGVHYYVLKVSLSQHCRLVNGGEEIRQR